MEVNHVAKEARPILSPVEPSGSYIFEFLRCWLSANTPMWFLDLMHDYLHGMWRNTQIYKDRGDIVDYGFGLLLSKPLPDVYMNNRHASPPETKKFTWYEYKIRSPLYVVVDHLLPILQ